MMSDQPNLQDVVGMDGMIHRMEVLCSARTVACAKRVVQETIESYFQPNKTFQDIRTLMKEGGEARCSAARQRRARNAHQRGLAVSVTT